MPFVTAKKMLQDAQNGKYAVGAFNAENMEMVQAVMNDGDVLAAAEEVKLRSRQYAKRQLTWFRRNEATRWHEWGECPDFQEALRTSTRYMEESGIL